MSNFFAASNIQISDGRDPRAQKITLASAQTELAALQKKAIHSVESCQHSIADFLNAVGDHQERRRRHLATTTSDRISPIVTEAAVFEAFLTSAKNLIISLTDPDQPIIASSPKAKAAPGKFRDSDLTMRLGQFTARQRSVFQLVAQGLPNKVIAYRLGITETTVKAHVGMILKKLGVYSRERAISLFTKGRPRSVS